jgi:osmoprotectant transport system ATP-binding protein
VIEIEHVSKSFDARRTWAVRDVTLRVEEGETLVLLGASGCGKTTLLRMVNRLIEPSGGEIRIDGRNVGDVPVLELRRSIGYVFQNIGLFPHMSVLDNAAIVPRLLAWPRDKRSARARELLALVGLDPEVFARRRPAQLSGGQQQRVGIARALAADPRYLLMDEPFGALDAVTREQLQGELERIRAASPRTIIFVTHDLFEALRLADRIAVMNAGRIEQVGTGRELMDAPATPFVAELFESARRQATLFTEASR